MKVPFVGLHGDFFGFSASMLCAVHCAVLPFLLSLSPMVGLRALQNPWIEYVIILISFCIASYTLVRSYHKHHQRKQALIIVVLGFLLIATGHLIGHGWQEILFTSSGAVTVAVAHLINWKQMRIYSRQNLTCTHS